MSRKEMMRLAERITNEQLFQMFKSAKDNIKDWTKVSNVNKGFSKGTSWNILAKDFDVNKEYKTIVKFNMIREFGKFLPPELLPKNDVKKPIYPITHQEPIFDKY